MAQQRSYPNGYVGRGVSFGLQGEADPEIVVLYNDYTNRRDGWTWDVQRPYLLAAARLFGCPTWFLERQLKEPGLCKYRRAFILDTIQFIETGRRTVSVYTISSLFDYKADSLPQVVPVNLPKGMDCIAKWVSHEGGFADLVESMAIFFGPKGPIAGV